MGLQLQQKSEKLFLKALEKGSTIATQRNKLSLKAIDEIDHCNKKSEKLSKKK